MASKVLVMAALAAAAASPAAATQSVPARLAAPATVARLKPMKWLYVISLVTGEGTPQRIGFRTVSLTDTTYHGTAAWLVIDARQMHTAEYAESVYVGRADLRPLYRIEHTPTGQTVSEFTGDSVRTVFDDDSGRVAVATANERDALPTLYLVEGLIAASSLGANWSASAKLTAVDKHESGVVPVVLRTVGEQRLAVPDGAFDAWVVSLTLGRSEEKLWVRKSDGVVLKEQVPVAGMAGASVEMLLGLNGVQRADTARTGTETTDR